MHFCRGGRGGPSAGFSRYPLCNLRSTICIYLIVTVALFQIFFYFPPFLSIFSHTSTKPFVCPSGGLSIPPQIHPAFFSAPPSRVQWVFQWSYSGQQACMLGIRAAETAPEATRPSQKGLCALNSLDRLIHRHLANRSSAEIGAFRLGEREGGSGTRHFPPDLNPAGRCWQSLFQHPLWATFSCPCSFQRSRSP